MKPSPLVLSGHEVTEPFSHLVGGKGKNLALLQEGRFSVPKWYVVTSCAFHLAIEKAGLGDRIRQAVDDLQRAGEIREWMEKIELPPELSAAIEKTHSSVFPENPFVAVRSSASAEDAPGESFAGLHDSFLYVGGTVLFDALRKVWASAFNERALAYRLERNIGLEDVSMAVVVQSMVTARVSGVMFTANPVSGDVHEIVVNSLYGAGEGLVSAGFDADTYQVSKKSLSITTNLATKEESLVLAGETGGLRQQTVPEELQKESSLSEDQVRNLARAGMAIEKRFGRPQDIEFCIDEDGAILMLQSRPVTTVKEYGPAAGNLILWDNSNIVESYAGVTSPMTFSFIRRAYAIVYHCFADVMGVSRRVIQRNQSTFENMLGLFRGRVYYNLFNWYRLICLFPNEARLMSAMESMMGVKESIAPEDVPTRNLARRYLLEYPRLVFKTGWNFLRIRTIVDRFERHFEHNYAKWSALDFQKMAPHQLMQLYAEMEEKLLWNWKAPIINDFYVMVFYDKLKRLCRRWCGDESGSLQNDLICGEGGIKSTEPTRMLLQLAWIAQRHPKLRQKILEEPSEALVNSIPDEPKFQEFTRLFRNYLELYGFRCVNELKLEEYSLRDRPSFVYDVLRNYLAADNPEILNVEAITAREAKIRAGAEERAFKTIAQSRIGFLKIVLFRRVLRNARLGVKNRENTRFARTRIYGLFRELLRAIGCHLAQEGLLDEPQQVFYLTLEELRDYIKGTAVTTDLRGLAQLRRSEFDRYRQEEGEIPDDRFTTYGMAYHRNLFKSLDVTAVSSPEDGTLQGTGCCPGQVTATVKVVKDPSTDMKLAGEILVAERTDPGWVPLYPSVSGILIERGSILSHSAIVAREMGIPTIVGIPHLLKSLKTGQKVSMDGTSGKVELAPQSAGQEGSPRS